MIDTDPTASSPLLRDRGGEALTVFHANARRHFADLVTPGLVEEHRQNPLGPKSPALLHVLDLLRQAPIPGKLAVLALKPGVSYQVIRLSRTHGVPNDLSDPARFSSEDAVLHEVFLRRLQELGILPAECFPAATATADEPRQPDISAHLIGYTDRPSAKPGESISVHLSSHDRLQVDLDLVRLGYGLPTGEVQESLVAAFDPVAVYPQVTHIGSYADTGALGADVSGTAPVLGLSFMPTAPGSSRQTLAGQDQAWTLDVDEHGRLAVSVEGHDTVLMTDPLIRGVWYSAALALDGSGAYAVRALAAGPASTGTAPAHHGPWQGSSPTPARMRTVPLRFAAAGLDQPHSHFNGKLETPFLADGTAATEVAAIRASLTPIQNVPGARVIWDIAAALTGGHLSTQTIPSWTNADGHGWTRDTVLDACCINTPTWAVTSSGWDGSQQDFNHQPDQWAAIHFHRDDLDDCRWPVTTTVVLPVNLSSGVYAVRAHARGVPVERLPVFVESNGPTTNKIALIVPSASYLAYANDHPGTQGQMAQATASRTPVLMDGDMFMQDHPELGRSCYDAHFDGSGVGYSTWRRPILNMRPTHRYHVGAWQLPADLHLVSWLAAENIDYDIITDHTLHERGLAALEGYRVVMTATHSEYYSTSMLDAVEQYISYGGRFLYLGANGFYWRIAFDEARPWVMELRRGENGSRAWQARPGEQHHAFTGERGGLWALLGRTPQRIFGVGFASQGFDNAGWYRKLPDAQDPRAAFIFDGVDQDTFGHHGTEGGAAGQEIDRYDQALGSPADALLLATSEGLSEGYLRAVEEIAFLVGGTSASTDPQVRADLTYFVNAAGGAVFSTGSIAWCGALGLDEGVSHITKNVLHRFVQEEPLSW